MDGLEEVLDDVRKVTGVLWQPDAPLAGGHQGTVWRVSAPGRASAVLKASGKPGWSEQVARAQVAVAAVRRRGYPTPAWLAAGETARGTAWHVSELARGAPVSTVDLASARLLVDVLESQRDLDPDPGRDWTGFVIDDPAGLGDLPRLAGEAGARLATRCDRLRDGARRARWPRTDMVHGDFRPANVLFVDGAVSAVVDVEAIGSGPRALDYATLLSDERVDPAAARLLARAGASSADPRVLRACVAHVFADLVGFVAARAPGDAARVAIHLDARAAMVEELVPLR